MPRILRPTLAILAVFAFLRPGAAQEPIRMARTPDISPDGKLVAFSYLGDIWVVEAIGGTARQVTTNPAHELGPVFSPDGRWIAFSSNRHGSYNVFVVPLQGGSPRRLTFDSDNDLVTGWSPDGKHILFASSRSVAFPPSFELYTVPVEGGMVHRVSADEGREGVYSPDGAHIAYTRGPGAWYRKGYRGSSNDDIWVSDADGTHNRQLTNFDGQDTSPMWSADGKSIYYVSEFYGTPANIVRMPSTPVGNADASTVTATPPQQITFHKDDAVRRARISANGEWIVYECGADVWVVSTKDSSTPRKLAIEADADDKVNPERPEIFTSHATEFVVAPDEKHAVFAVHGKLFLTPVAGSAPKAVQLTDGPSMDHGAAWAPDGNRILFLSDRGGHEDVYAIDSAESEHPHLADAHKFKIARLTDTPDPEFGLSFAPDGKRVAFVRDGRLWSMNPDGSDPKAIVDQPLVFDYDWSPDGKWIVCARRDGASASELYIVPSGGPTPQDPARNVTRYATYNGDVSWSLDGKKIAFVGDRHGKNNLLVLNLQKPLAPGVTPPAMTGVDIDWDDIHLRTDVISTLPIDEAAISPDGAKVAFRAGGDLWTAATNGGQTTRLTTGGQQPRMIQWSRKKTPFGAYADLIYFLDGQGTLRATRSTPQNGADGKPDLTPALLPFKVKLTVRADEEFTEMFDQTWRYLSENFYDVHFHGHDWDAVRAKYRPLVKYIAMKEDLYSLLYLMMGELNASHLGVTGYGTTPEEQTAELGLVWDEAYRGKGLRVLDVLKRGPADKRGLSIKAGEFVLAIDGVEVTEAVDLSKLLNGKVGETVELQVAADPNADPKTRRRVEVQAISRYDSRNDSGIVEGARSLMYDRWVDNNAKRVAELSGGKLGYIHIPDMEEGGMERFLRSLYSDNFDKEAIVLDVRYNGGGNTHDQILNYLMGHGHTTFRERDGLEGTVVEASDRKWNKPLVLLINNRSYSDAEVFPSAFRTLGLGKLVGQPTAGYVIGTGEVRLIDGSRLRIPHIGVYTPTGVDMDKEGVRPDVLVEPHPDQLAKGKDVQLEKAVEVLQAEVAEWKKAHPSTVAAGPDAPKPPPTPPGPAAPPMVMPMAK
ncbi:MAG TPA: S41 family peptidase [Gemmataceae bacterium]|nr:S41 family peptidase [Gemmataceae bacterium]